MSLRIDEDRTKLRWPSGILWITQRGSSFLTAGKGQTMMDHDIQRNGKLRILLKVPWWRLEWWPVSAIPKWGAPQEYELLGSWIPQKHQLGSYNNSYRRHNKNLRVIGTSGGSSPGTRIPGLVKAKPTTWFSHVSEVPTTCRSHQVRESLVWLWRGWKGGAILGCL